MDNNIDKIKIAYNRKESYSSLSLLTQCPYKYYLKYIKGFYFNEKTLPLELGNLCHKILELKFKEPHTNFFDVLKKGYNKENILGLEDISNVFFDDWIKTSKKSGLTYQEKINNFIDYIKSPNEKEWKTIEVEKPFEIEYGGIKIIGKIDKIQKNSNGDYKVVDYKTSDMPYKDEELKTPLQMFIYALALKQLYGSYPKEFEYDFVLLKEKRKAMTKGWEKRGERILNNIIEKRKNFFLQKDYPPSPTPLCYWCEMSAQGCVKDILINGKCNYYSLWTPENKTFEVADQYFPYNNEKKKEENFIW